MTAIAALVIFAPARNRLRELERAAERFGAGELSTRAPEHGRDEIAHVATAFNQWRPIWTAHRGVADLRPAETANARRYFARAADAAHHDARVSRHAGHAGDRRWTKTNAGAMWIPLAARRFDSSASCPICSSSRDSRTASPPSRRASSPSSAYLPASRAASSATRPPRTSTIRTCVDPAAIRSSADPDRLDQAISNLVATRCGTRPLAAPSTLESRGDDGGCELR